LAFHSGREADHSPSSSAEVKNGWSCASTPQYTFMAWCSLGRAQGLYVHNRPTSGGSYEGSASLTRNTTVGYDPELPAISHRRSV
jgi:hypothetical protein